MVYKDLLVHNVQLSQGELQGLQGPQGLTGTQGSIGPRGTDPVSSHLIIKQIA